MIGKDHAAAFRVIVPRGGALEGVVDYLTAGNVCTETDERDEMVGCAGFQWTENGTAKLPRLVAQAALLG